MNPTAGVVFTPDGSLYGTTTGGGTIWKIDPSGNYSVLHSFTGTVTGNAQASDGATPVGGLVLAGDGYLYGMTFAGGPVGAVYASPPTGPYADWTTGAGVVYRISPSGNYSVMLDLDAPLAAPTGFAIVVDSPTCVTLSWSAVWGAESYDILRSTSPSGPFTSIGNVTGTSYEDCSLVAGTTYYYEVAGVLNTADGPPSQVLSVTPSDAAPVRPRSPHHRPRTRCCLRGPVSRVQRRTPCSAPP